MSRILRRPMFRGGGPVNSYGTGIAAPLVPGYQWGGSINTPRRGLVSLPGGYAGELFNAAELTMPSSTNITSGMELLAKNKALRQGNVPMIPVNTGTKDEVPAGVDTESTEIEDINLDGSKELTSFEKMMTNDQFGNQDPTALPDNSMTAKEKLIETYTPKPNKTLIDILSKESTYTDQDGVERSTITGEIIKGKGRDLEEDARINQQWYDDNKTAIDDLDTGAGEVTEEPIVDAKTMMEENAELFKEMLGIKKARGQDISDMLLRFSGSKGNTLGEKFQNYTALESAAGPGRSEQIGKTAAGLSIQDYVAGKRAREAVDLMKSKVDYEYGKKGELVNVQKDDNATEALLKIGKKGDVKPNSDAAIKYLVGIADDRSDVFSINQKGLMKKIGENPAKAMKKLKNGVNIVRDGGQIAIVITDGNNITNIFDSVSEYWNANK